MDAFSNYHKDPCCYSGLREIVWHLHKSRQDEGAVIYLGLNGNAALNQFVSISSLQSDDKINDLICSKSVIIVVIA